VPQQPGRLCYCCWCFTRAVHGVAVGVRVRLVLKTCSTNDTTNDSRAEAGCWNFKRVVFMARNDHVLAAANRIGQEMDHYVRVR
jgi:hypothetical protein